MNEILYKNENIYNKKFDRLKIIEELKRNKNKKRVVLCICDCGNKKKIVLQSIIYGLSRSCGCIHKEMLKKNKTTHGMSGKRIYTIWNGINTRCNNKNSKHYGRYGGRGIKLCNEWLNVNVFSEWALNNGYSDNLTIDRIDNNKGYCPSNCRWVSMFEQSYNRRTPRNNSSGYAGIGKRNGKYRATITYKGNNKHIGMYKTLKDAICARNEYILKNKLPHKLQKING